MEFAMLSNFQWNSLGLDQFRVGVFFVVFDSFFGGKTDMYV